jgi:hypothetical protein
VGSVLFAQLAVSAYACPGVSAALALAAASNAVHAQQEGPKRPAAAHDAQASTHCQAMASAMDAPASALCVEHCQPSSQCDHPATIALPLAVLSALYLLPPAFELRLGPRPAAHESRARWVVSPPHSLLHCCFRL